MSGSGSHSLQKWLCLQPSTTKPVMENTPTPPNNFLNWVEIKNFKSIKDLRLDCKRVNVFIGKPNVGKSNILEALGLLGTNNPDEKYLKGVVRYDTIRDLFRDSDVESPFSVHSNTSQITIESSQSESGLSFTIIKTHGLSPQWRVYLSTDGQLLELSDGVKDGKKYDRTTWGLYRKSSIKKYEFSGLHSFDFPFSDYLLPPHGQNLYAVVNRNSDLWQEFANLFKEQGLEFVLDEREQTFVLQKKEGFKAKQYPFFSIADTFRRFMFYITAIESNKDSVLIFEEPEVHSFPPYTQELANRIVSDIDNQYFISTHSPYLLHTLIENLETEQLNVFVTYYQDFQTKIHALNADDFRHILDFSTDVFFNLDKFIPNARPVTA
jgi:AAA15 family ATPase/GTPase